MTLENGRRYVVRHEGTDTLQVIAAECDATIADGTRYKSRFVGISDGVPVYAVGECDEVQSGGRYFMKWAGVDATSGLGVYVVSCCGDCCCSIPYPICIKITTDGCCDPATKGLGLAAASSWYSIIIGSPDGPCNYFTANPSQCRIYPGYKYRFQVLRGEEITGCSLTAGQCYAVITIVIGHEIPGTYDMNGRVVKFIRPINSCSDIVGSYTKCGTTDSIGDDHSTCDITGVEVTSTIGDCTCSGPSCTPPYSAITHFDIDLPDCWSDATVAFLVSDFLSVASGCSKSYTFTIPPGPAYWYATPVLYTGCSGYGTPCYGYYARISYELRVAIEIHSVEGCMVGTVTLQPFPIVEYAIYKGACPAPAASGSLTWFPLGSGTSPATIPTETCDSRPGVLPDIYDMAGGCECEAFTTPMTGTKTQSGRYSYCVNMCLSWLLPVDCSGTDPEGEIVNLCFAMADAESILCEITAPTITFGSIA